MDKDMPVCTFLVPLLRDSDDEPHAPILWRILQDALVGAFGGYQGPVLHYYRSKVEELRSLLRKVGNAFDQRAIYLEVAGYAEFLEPLPEDGFLGPR